MFFVESGDGHLNGMTQVGDINVSPNAFNDTYNASAIRCSRPATLPDNRPAGERRGDVLSKDVALFSDTFQISTFQSANAQPDPRGIGMPASFLEGTS